MEGFVRPEVVVLPDSALVPDRNVIRPAPNRFTHELTRAAPFYFDGAQQQGRQPNGEFPDGTRVVLLVHHGGTHCRVVDSRGLYVEVEFDALRAAGASG